MGQTINKGQFRIGTQLDRKGEIEISGPSVISQYLSGGDSNSFNEGWLCTGDVGQIDSDGNLYITGRLSEFIKRQGFKISLAEIDRCLLEMPDVAEALSFSYQHERMGEDLITGVTLLDNKITDSVDLRQRLFSILPGYKVPSDVIILAEMPRSTIGKHSRKLLKQTIKKYSENLSNSQDNRSELCDLWCKELECTSIALTQNLFQLGADIQSFKNVLKNLNSISKTQVNARRFLRSRNIAEQIQYCSITISV